MSYFEYKKGSTDQNSELVSVGGPQVVDDEVLVADVVGEVDPVDVGVWNVEKDVKNDVTNDVENDLKMTLKRLLKWR